MKPERYFRSFALYDGERFLAIYSFIGGANERRFKETAEAEQLRVEPVGAKP